MFIPLFFALEAKKTGYPFPVICVNLIISFLYSVFIPPFPELSTVIVLQCVLGSLRIHQLSFYFIPVRRAREGFAVLTKMRPFYVKIIIFS